MLIAGLTVKRRRLALLVGTTLSCVTLAWILAFDSFDLDRDGWPDSIVLGRSSLHFFATVERQTAPTSRPSGYGRLYDVPPDYVQVIVKRAFGSQREWTLLSTDDRLRSTQVMRRADGARAVVRIDEWRGRSLARVIAAESADPSAKNVVAAVFHTVESLLFHGIATPGTVRDFAPPS